MWRLLFGLLLWRVFGQLGPITPDDSGRSDVSTHSRPADGQAMSDTPELAVAVRLGEKINRTLAEAHPEALQSVAQVNFKLRYDPKQWLLVLRIQKCGTTFLLSMLHWVYNQYNLKRNKFCCHSRRDEQKPYRCSIKMVCSDEMMRQVYRQQFYPNPTSKFITDGHTDYHHLVETFEEVYPNVSYQLLVMVRNPLARVLSEYNHLRRFTCWDYSPRIKPVLGQNESHFLRYVNHPGHWLLNNRQTRMLAGCCFDSPELMLAKAKEHLRHATLIGLQEEMEPEVMRRLWIYFNVPVLNKQQVLALNAKKQRVSDQNALQLTTLSAQTIKQVEEANHLDTQLYEYAKTLFAEQKPFFD
eukprot:gb/GEZN01008219.1/.p1 GENE.gb/GEZN01008219.1/~~gb/GEZN01008219.1/.p1  ORF type:complete len:356 (-),score=58.71 gb/GEZN01008219.1/:224-1291(-)